MSNFELKETEVVLYEGEATSENFKGKLQLTLTSEKLVVEQEKGMFKKVRELIEIIELSRVKFYNETVQIKQHGSNVEIQTTVGNITFTFSGLFEARKFAGKAIDATTNTTLAKRVSEKTKDAIDMVDDTLGVDTRGTLKGVLENGIKGVLFNGLGKKK